MNALEARAVSLGDNYGTPEWLFEFAQHRYGKFQLDVCASRANSKCQYHIGEPENGLACPWENLNWCNPPYSDITPWVEKANWEASYRWNSTVMLPPADFSTDWFRLIWGASTRIDILNHRVRFDGATGSPKFASMFCVIQPHKPAETPPIVSLVDARPFKKEWEARQR